MRRTVTETDPSLMNTVPQAEAGSALTPEPEPVPTSASAKFDPLVGTNLAERYEIIRRIGEGGMGAVYEARHSIIGKRVAIKVLLEKFLENEELIARLLQEARLASSIGHQNIVDVTDFGTTRDGRAFVVMEFLEGEPLSELIMRDAPLPVERSLAIVKQVASALGAAHDKGIVHRDVKPENVYLVRRGDLDFVKVVDFGVSKAVRTQEETGSEWARLTRTGAVLGTPLFMSPEQAGGSEDVDDVLVTDRAREPRLLQQARDEIALRQELLEQHLDGDALADDGVLRLVDGAHAALADSADDLVAPSERRAHERIEGARLLRGGNRDRA